MTLETSRIRIDEDDASIDVALAPEDFDQRVRGLIPEDRIKNLPSQIGAITYWRGDFPSRSLWMERLWWAIAFVAGLVFLYGLYALGQKGLSYIVR